MWERGEQMETYPITKNEYAYQRLKEEIMAGKYAAGEKLVVDAISRRYNISSMPVREAIKRLEEEGFVQTVPYRGARVHTWDYDEFNELMQISTALESTASRLAVRNITREGLARLREIVREMEDAARLRNYSQYNQLNFDFHFTLYEGGGNRELYALISELHDRTYPYTSVSFHPEGRLPVSLRQHQEWVEAIAAGDSAASAAMCRKQRADSYKNFLDYLEQCLTHLDVPEAHYYIYGFASTFSKLSIEQIQKKINQYRKSLAYIFD